MLSLARRMLIVYSAKAEHAFSIVKVQLYHCPSIEYPWPSTLSHSGGCFRGGIFIPLWLQAQLKSSRQPWSYFHWILIMAFLPHATVNSTVMVLADRILKAALFIPQPKWPSTSQTTSGLNHHFFCLNGRPCNIVSNQIHPCVSQLCSLLGNTTTLSFGFHLQSIVQAERPIAAVLYFN